MKRTLFLLLLACDRPVALPTDAGLRPHPAAVADGPPPEVLCLQQMDLEIMQPVSACTVLRKIADACEIAQPDLAQAARDASCLQDDARDLALLRAARKHPAFRPECDVPDADAAKPADVAFRGRSGCNDAAKDCYLSAGTHAFRETLARVAGGRQRWFDEWEIWTEFQCADRKKR